MHRLVTVLLFLCFVRPVFDWVGRFSAVPSGGIDGERLENIWGEIGQWLAIHYRLICADDYSIVI